eukprot:jgi/Mesvir1/5218/Mv15347-RA.1
MPRHSNERYWNSEFDEEELVREARPAKPKAQPNKGGAELRRAQQQASKLTESARPAYVEPPRVLSAPNSLVSMFQGVVTRDVIEQVYAATGGDPQLAAHWLLEMAAPATSATSGGGLSSSIDGPTTATPVVTEGKGKGKEVVDSGSREGADADELAVRMAGLTVAAQGGDEAPVLWSCLPEEVELIIFGHLSFKDAARAALTCRRFAQLAAEMRRRVRTLVPQRDLNIPALVAMISYFPSVREVRLKNYASASWEQLHELFTPLPQGAPGIWQGVPSVVQTRGGLLPSPGFGPSSQLPPVPPGLGRRFLQGASAGRGQSQPFMLRSDVEEVDKELGIESSGSSDCKGGEGAGEGVGEGEGASAGTAGAAGAAGAGPSRVPGLFGVESLDLKGCVALDGSHLEKIRSAFSQLKQLSVANCPNINDACVQKLFSGTRLVALDTSGTAVTNKAFLGLAQQRRGTLQALHCGACDRLTRLTLLLPATMPLAELALPCCRQLSELQLSSRQLTSLNVAKCGSLRRLSAVCPALQQANLAQCGALESVDWQCPAIERLNMWGAKSLSPDELTSMVDASAACLTELQMNGCLELEAVRGEFPRLESVDLSGCASLRRVIITAPRLARLDVHACRQLLEANVHCGTALALIDVTNCSALHVLCTRLVPGALLPVVAGGSAAAPGCQQEPTAGARGSYIRSRWRGNLQVVPGELRAVGCGTELL